MLKSVSMKDVASYGDTLQKLDSLKIVNICYGDNGSGKSTLAQCMSDSTNAKFSECKLAWEDGVAHEVLIYNKSFVESTLAETQVKGVFTFGDGASSVLKDIDRIKREVIAVEEQRRELIRSNSELNKTAQALDRDFENHCWELQKKYVDSFKPLFEGYRGSKTAFKDRCVSFVGKTSSYDFEYLSKQTSALFADSIEKLVEMPFNDCSNVELVEAKDIFRHIIVGKDSVPVAGLISRLGNGDWIRQGLSYFDGSTCPFCQQRTNQEFKDQLESFFDEEYDKNIKLLKLAVDEYDAVFTAIFHELESMQGWSNTFFDYSAVKDKILAVKNQYLINSQLLERKLKEPSLRVDFPSVKSELVEVYDILSKVNLQITEYNRKIDNIKAERESLKNEVWAFVVSEVANEHSKYLEATTPLRSTVESNKQQERLLVEKRNRLLDETSRLEKAVVSTKPVMEKMNALLRSFGFDSFHIVDAESEGYYRIARQDGSYAAETLSEGERTFITFLYFYHLLQDGKVSGEAVGRIVIFDDPVSSLDSKILFVVSTMIRKLYNKHILSESKIKQIFIFTHNIYFHKEVSYLKNLKACGLNPLSKKDFCFFIIKNRECNSTITRFSDNPVKSGYELLWSEVRQAHLTGTANITLCNTMRRILEYYFKYFGGIPLDKLIEPFDGEEKVICRSLVSWIHDGSHFMPDGIDFSFQHDLANHYLPVFKKIFYNMNHEGHYEMMMCEDS